MEECGIKWILKFIQLNEFFFESKAPQSQTKKLGLFVENYPVMLKYYSQYTIRFVSILCCKINVHIFFIKIFSTFVGV